MLAQVGNGGNRQTVPVHPTGAAGIAQVDLTARQRFGSPSGK